jgi:hypothetical protein
MLKTQSMGMKTLAAVPFAIAVHTVPDQWIAYVRAMNANLVGAPCQQPAL